MSPGVDMLEDSWYSPTVTVGQNIAEEGPEELFLCPKYLQPKVDLKLLDRESYGTI